MKPDLMNFKVAENGENVKELGNPRACVLENGWNWEEEERKGWAKEVGEEEESIFAVKTMSFAEFWLILVWERERNGEIYL